MADYIQDVRLMVFAADKPAKADLLWEKNIVSLLISQADKFKQTEKELKLGKHHSNDDSKGWYKTTTTKDNTSALTIEHNYLKYRR